MKRVRCFRALGNPGAGSDPIAKLASRPRPRSFVTFLKVVRPTSLSASPSFPSSILLTPRRGWREVPSGGFRKERNQVSFSPRELRAFYARAQAFAIPCYLSLSLLWVLNFQRFLFSPPSSFGIFLPLSSFLFLIVTFPFSSPLFFYTLTSHHPKELSKTIPHPLIKILLTWRSFRSCIGYFWLIPKPLCLDVRNSHFLS